MQLHYKDKVLSVGGGTSSVAGVPSGFIGMWSGTEIPDGWALCDGENGTPDLRGRFILAANDSHGMGTTGGSEEVTLTVEQMPAHNHLSGMSQYNVESYTTVARNVNSVSASVSKNVNTGTTGSSKPHNNMPPYYVLAFIIKL